MRNLNSLQRPGPLEIECIRAEEMNRRVSEIIRDIELFGAPKVITHRGYVTAAMVPAINPRCFEMFANRAGTCQQCLALQPEPYVLRHNSITVPLPGGVGRKGFIL